ncbi:hypothetical protein V6Z12_A03G049500 [Gossypium hirsutum]|uniref:Transmembrane protein n=1 Tax=Gossypium tomentosum TaxID=34277 RepID=A0A5D2R482_GOSTO|nr:hypothetical protein ES332_A03G049700v1 [Gossypium tomentosum]
MISIALVTMGSTIIFCFCYFSMCLCFVFKYGSWLHLCISMVWLDGLLLMLRARKNSFTVYVSTKGFRGWSVFGLEHRQVVSYGSMSILTEVGGEDHCASCGLAINAGLVQLG